MVLSKWASGGDAGYPNKPDRPVWPVRFHNNMRSLRFVDVVLLQDTQHLAQPWPLGRRLVLLVAAPRCLGLLGLAGLQAPHKAIDLPGGVDNALLAGVEGMAVRADIDAQVLLGRVRRPVGPACRADDRRLKIFGMNICLHGIFSRMHGVNRCYAVVLSVVAAAGAA